MRCALALARANAGNNRPASIAMMAMTTNSSISVKAVRAGKRFDIVNMRRTRDRRVSQRLIRTDCGNGSRVLLCGDQPDKNCHQFSGPDFSVRNLNHPAWARAIGRVAAPNDRPGHRVPLTLPG